MAHSPIQASRLSISSITANRQFPFCPSRRSQLALQLGPDAQKTSHDKLPSGIRRNISNPKTPHISWAIIYSRLGTFPELVESVNFRERDFDRVDVLEQMTKECPAFHESICSREKEEFMADTFCNGDESNVSTEKKVVLLYEIRRTGSYGQQWITSSWEGESLMKAPCPVKDRREYKRFLRAVGNRRNGLPLVI